MGVNNLVWVEMNDFDNKLYLGFDNDTQYEVPTYLLNDEDYHKLKTVFDYIDNEEVFNRIFKLANLIENED